MRAELLRLQALGLPRLDAQRLLLTACARDDTDRAWLLTHDTDILSAPAAQRLAALLRRWQDDEPMGYLLGHQAFYGLDLRVGPGVLVPRPDTETLVDWALSLTLPAHARVLDLGTGSGAIALSLAQQRPTWQVWASDLSPEALTCARNNAERLGLSVRWLAGRWLDALPADAPAFDLIVSNPPYIAGDDPHLPALRHEPTLALTSGADGLDALRHLSQNAPGHLAPGGWLLLEHGWDQAPSVCAWLRCAGLDQVTSHADLGGHMRVSGGQRPDAAQEGNPAHHGQDLGLE